MRYTFVTLSLLIITALGASEPAPSAAPTLTSVAVYPADINLNTMRDRQSFVVQATFSDGITRDVTAQVTPQLKDGSLVKLDKSTLYPVKDGTTELKISYAGRDVVVPVVVKDATADRPISFKLDVMPVFMKTGCNVGSCHGAARGKDGFRLSLFGFDPDGDHYRLTRELNGRRLNLAVPEASMLLEKSVGKVPHTGGKKMEEGGELYNEIVRWLQAGAPQDAATVAKPVSLELYPKAAVLDGKGETQKLTVRAKYSDGSDRDVTHLAFFMSNNDRSAAVSQEGFVTAGERGEAFISARFETFNTGVPFIVLPKGLQFTFPNVPENNYIDTLVFNKLKKLRMSPSGICDDATFLRRVFLDIIGTVPTAEEVKKFLDDQDPKKREKLVDDLLGRKEFVEVWVMKWAELLQIRSTINVSYKSTLLYFNWLQDRISNNVPMDQMVQELLSSKGGTFSNPATNFYQMETDTLKMTENVAQVFMGMRVQCAQCHNHPFDRWTMDDYYSFASFFSQVGRKGAEDPRELIVFNGGGGEVNHPTKGKPLPPKFLGGETPNVAGKDRREVLAGWLASDKNPYFATNLANIVWTHFFGKGIVEPVDDVRVSNPAANDELLQELGTRFRTNKYDFRKLIRDICTSRTYQLVTQPNETNELDSRNFAKASVRRLRAEVLLDVVSQVTETKNKFQGLPLGARAVQIADGQASTYFLTTFGRATRETVCSCEVKMEPNLSQALHLLNGDTVSNRVQSGGVITRALAAKKTPAEIIEDLYLRCLNRKCSREELNALCSIVNTAADKPKALEDVFWGILNSREFLFNH
ncbi:MAG: DUF1549 domain-containing protein [Gemmatales bacterium]